jgi:hypothetical protein
LNSENDGDIIPADASAVNEYLMAGEAALPDLEYGLGKLDSLP